MIKKNDILDLEIIDNGSAFEGIAKHDGMVIFVPGAVITEKVRAKIIKVTSSYAIARVEEILVKSEYRGQGIYKQLLKELETRENECNFITDLVGPENEGMQITLEKMNFESSDLITYYRMINKKGE